MEVRSEVAPAARPLPSTRRGRLLVWFVAIALCVILLPTTIYVLHTEYGLDARVASALAIAQAVPLLLAPVRPLWAWAVILPADVAGAFALLSVDLGPEHVWPFPPMQLVGYVGLCLALSLRARRRTLIAVWLTTAVVDVGLLPLTPPDTIGGFLPTVLGGVTLALGAALRERQVAQRRLADQLVISEAERGRRTLLEERARIARELHDVVAHHMSVITVQANTAVYRLEDLPASAQAEFSSIAATARESLEEMRRLLGVLRNEESGGELAPQPGLSDIPHLVEATVRAGVPVELTLGEDAVHETVGLSAYRIVQEALANVVRHAPGAPTRVSVSRDRDLLDVVVENAAPAAAPAPPLEAVGTGHGLVGMRERVRLVGGTVEAVALPDGGFRVAARLPVDERRAP